ncbi:MAG: hypothetical protein H0X36_15665 [Sphingomonadaceae bacterium]|nr:hypothetical protein [Sphingomonadaceae bacterium]
MTRFARDLLRDTRGNVLMLTGLAVIPLVAATGMGIDYSRAARLQTKLNAAADAAALAAVSQPMMVKTDDEANSFATFIFNQQAGADHDASYNAANLTITITHTGAVSSNRIATVTYTADSHNFFGNFVGTPTTTVGGTSQANATRAPNIDFYMMLDTSPSMALPATSAGITQMVSATGGCAFACHQTTLNADYLVDGSGNRISYYTYAKTHNISLRTDLVPTAVSDLTQVAKDAAINNHANYRMALANFDYKYNNIVGVPSDLDFVKTKVPNATLLPYCQNNQRICGTGDNDTATDYTTALGGALLGLPGTAGNGTNDVGDTPQAILFLITDGMRDENSGGRKMGPMPTAQCTTVKNRGVRIAILYTRYLPESASDSWSQTNVRAPFLDPADKITPALTDCASPGLLYTVSTDGDISAALAALFRQAIATAHLLK